LGTCTPEFRARIRAYMVLVWERSWVSCIMGTEPLRVSMSS
jgi:hypothetical protein